MMESVVSNSFEIKNEPIQVVPEVDEQTNESEFTSRVSSPRTTTGTGTPVELSKTEINSQRRSYFLEQQHSLNQQKLSDSAKRFKYLIGLTDLFRHFIDARAKKDLSFKTMLEEVERNSHLGVSNNKSSTDHRHRKTEKEEDAELLNDEEGEDLSSAATMFTESPGYIHGQMRDYQVQGLNWLISLYENNISGILADEMGLGKTLQTIAFLGYLRYIRGVTGPHIVIVPKSTLHNWQKEFTRWTPEVNTVILQGDKESRAQLIQDRVLSCDFDVCITSYEMVLREKHQLKKFAWQYIIVDEAHRIKNEESMLSQIIRVFNSRNRLLVTGTPLQNNLHELWALLNFILPDVFSDSQVFDEWFAEQGADQDKVVQQLHRVLRPFLLRRIKSDVETSLLPKKEINLYLKMSDMQIKWYQKILEKDIDAVNGAVGKREKTRLLNIVMQLRKCCNHPYLFEGAEPGPPYTTDEHLIYNCGKMMILDKLLTRAKAKGSRVLIFSQMSRVLDILEDYCIFRNYLYCRIDGSTIHEDRINAIDDYNRPGSDKFVFLLTTRAGGLGINLTTADTVILYDSDWNPQADLQAMDRAHRIGQTKQVYVYRFVTENAIEEKVLERAAQKLRLDQLVIQQGRAQHSIASGPASQNDLLGMIQHGAEAVFQQTAKKEQDEGQDDNKENQSITDEDIDDILTRGEEKTAQLNSRFEKLGLDDVQKFNADSAYEWNGKDFSIKKQDGNKLLVNAGKFWINPTKRERKENYSIDSYYKDVLNSKHPGPQAKVPGAPKPPKQINIQDHQFYPQRLIEIQEKETAYYRKQIGYQVPLPEGKDSDLEQREAEQQLEQAEIDEAEPLTAREEEEKKKLSQSGFSSWNRRDFTHFIQSSAKHGRSNIKGIASEFEDKTEDEVRKYSKAFWRKYSEIDGYDRYISQIEAGEERTKKVRQQKELIKQKVESYTAPLQQLQLINAVGHGKKVYTDDEDRFLVVQLHRFGLDSENLYEKIRDAIRESPMFRFDWFMLSRTPLELNRRCATLIGNIVTELEGRHSAALPHKKRKAKQEDEYDEDDDEYGEVEEDEFVDDDDEEEVEEEVFLDDESPPPQPKGKRKQPQRKSNGRGKRQRTNGTRSSRATDIE